MGPRAIMTLSETITERKGAEEEFKSRLIASSQDCIKVLDLEGRLLSMNEGGMQALEICDVRPFLNSSWIEFWDGEDRASAQAAVEAARNGGTGRFIGYFATTATKQPRWWDVVVSPIRDPQGKPERLLAVSRDVTKIKLNEEALHNSEERVRLILDSAAEAIFGCDPEGTCLFCNRAAARLLGYNDPADLLRKNMHTLEHHTRKDGRPYPIEECPIYLGFQRNEGVHRDDEVFWRKDGRSFPVEFWSHPIVRDGRTLGAVITFVDITERKRAEEALRKSEQRKRTLLEINNAIITNLTKDTLHHSICEALRRVLPVDRASLSLYQPGRDTLRIVALERDWGLDYFGVGTELSRKDSHHGWVFDHQRPLLRRDLETEWQYPLEQRLLSTGLRSFCIAPLILEGKSIGALGVGSDKAHQYSEADAEFLCEVAGQVALAAANMKAYEEIAGLKARLEKENVYLQEQIRTEHNFEEIVGNSPALLAVLHKVEQVAPTDSTVLIYGETGTGKELIARAIHDRSPRKDRTLVTMNCSAISAGLVESELFGHLKGAFTGAIERRVGRFELANGGTIFLDEIGELPLETQVKLLRVLQEQEFEPVGSSRPLQVDVRVIAATNRNLREAVEAGRFRSDLFYRLNVFPLELPPLRERRSDIPQLVTFYVSRFSVRFRKSVEGVSPDSMDRLMSYPWPGNVRELQNVIERGVVLSTGPTLRLDQDLLPIAASARGPEIPGTTAQETLPADLASSRMPTLEEMERSHILAALKRTSGVVNGPKGAARILNLHPNTLRHRMDKLGIKRSSYRLP
jgi:formate hydrogenlyase transcriptional activator